MKDKISRKDFFKRVVGISFLGFSSAALIQACGGEEKKQVLDQTGPCSDISKLSDSEKQTRVEFEYTIKSPHKDKFCNNCNLFTPPKNGKQCGTCEIVKGPINANGYCTQWIAKG